MGKQAPRSLRERFEEAVDRVNSWQYPIPPDTLLRLYAFYKIARSEERNMQDAVPLIDAFKANALLQVRHMEAEEAMMKYIETFEQELLKARS